MGLLSTMILAFAPMSLTVLASHNRDCENAADVGNWFVNFCEEKCVCEQTASSPTPEYSHVCYREREEFTCMSASRRQRFLDTYKAVTTPGNPQYDQMRQLIQKHADGFHFGIHSTQYFLPWHRWFIRAVEDVLRNQDCRVTMPWWRWSKKSANWWTGTPFHPASTWLGTNGQGFGQCVVDGPFASWAPPDQTCLRRSFQFAGMPTGAQIANTLNLPPTNFGQFSDDLEVLIHNLPHVRINGHMVTLASPRAPEFFLHHGYIDQLWDAWQRRSNAHMNSYGSFPKVNHPLPYTYGPSDSNVDDHFVLKEQRVRYVTVQANPAGRGHLTMLPMCLWIKVEKEIFSLEKMVDGLGGMDPKMLAEVPQLPWKAPTFQEMEWWFEGANKESAEQGREKLAMAERRAKIANALLANPVEKFEDPASQMLGYDVRKLASMLQICPIGKAWDPEQRQCVKDKKQKKDLKKVNKQVKNSKVFLGEVVGPEDLEG